MINYKLLVSGIIIIIVFLALFTYLCIIIKNNKYKHSNTIVNGIATIGIIIGFISSICCVVAGGYLISLSIEDELFSFIKYTKHV
jgi:hypothetical protein